MDERESLRTRLLDHDRARGGGQGSPSGRQRTLIHSRILPSYVAELEGYIQARHEAGLLVDQAIFDRLNHCQNLSDEFSGGYCPERHSQVAPGLPPCEVGPQLFPSATPIARPSNLEVSASQGSSGGRVEARVPPVPPKPPAPPTKTSARRQWRSLLYLLD